MKNGNVHKFPSLTPLWQNIAMPISRERLKAAQAMLKALSEERFKFESESWFRHDDIPAKELLLRAWDEDGNLINNGLALSTLYEQGLFPVVDKFLIIAALKKTEPDPDASITINALCSTLSDQEFWNELDQLDSNHDPEQIIFEILEYEENYIVDETMLEEAYSKGYRFALDDFTPDQQNWERLEKYSSYIDYIKLDGKFVRAGLNGDPDFLDTIGEIKSRYPEVEILAEFVETPIEAFLLFNNGISLVQGRDLNNGQAKPMAARAAVPA